MSLNEVKKILVIRLRSIGDTVLSTPSLLALRAFFPDSQIDVLLENWVAPLLSDFASINNVVSVEKDNLKSRLQTLKKVRREKYDLVINLHGGTTSTFFTRASGAKIRVGYAHYRYNFFYTHLAEPASTFWQKEKTHSAEQQLALLGSIGITVKPALKSFLNAGVNALDSIKKKINSENFALFHPVAAFDTKQWSTEKFARIAEFLR